MALLQGDGFEIDFADNTAGLWTAFTNHGSFPITLQYTAAQIRTGNGAVRIYSTSVNNMGYLTKTLAGSYTELFLGFGIYIASGTALDGYINSLVPLVTMVSSGSTRQLTLSINEITRVLEVRRGDNNGVQVGIGSTGLNLDTWYYVDWRMVIDDAAGIIQVRTNGNSEIDQSGIDTNVADGNVKTILLGLPDQSAGFRGGAIDCYIDDFAVVDTTGTVTNTWINQARIERLDPNADGNYSQWTSTGGAVDYTEVDDVATYGNLPDGATTMLSHAVVGERTGIALDNTALSGDVLGIVALSNVSLDAAGASEMAHFVRLSAADYDQASFNPGTSWEWRQDILTASPATGLAWTTGEIDGMELGWKVT